MILTYDLKLSNILFGVITPRALQILDDRFRTLRDIRKREFQVPKSLFAKFFVISLICLTC